MNQIETQVKHHRILRLLILATEDSGMGLSLDRYIRLERLWKVIPINSSIEQLQRWLCPIFAVNKQQQNLFNDLFESIIENDLNLNIFDLNGEDEARGNDKNKIDQNKSATSSGELSHEGDNNRKPLQPESFTQKESSRNLVLELDKCNDSSYIWNLAPKDCEITIHISETFNKKVVDLKRRESTSNQILDLPATLKATMANGGLPKLKYAYLSQPPEYLFLIERFSRNDHRAAFFDYIFKTLRKNDILIDRFYYDGAPNINRNEYFPAGLTLNELSHRYSNAHLIMVGSGYRLLSSRTGKLVEWASPFNYWRKLTLLSPVPKQKWGYKEYLLSGIFSLSPYSVDNIFTSAIDVDSHYRQTKSNYADVHTFSTEILSIEKPLIQFLKRNFRSDLFCWIATCSIYPALYFDLTIRLGKVTSDYFKNNLVTAENLLSITRLPWFMTGIIPVDERKELMQFLNNEHHELYQSVLVYLQEFLQHNKPENLQSTAWAEYKINLAFLKALANEVHDPETLEDLQTVVKRLNRDRSWDDFVLPENLIKGLDFTSIANQYKTDKENKEQYEDLKEESLLSRRKEKILRAWESIVDSYENGTVIRGTVISKTKGGLIVECSGLETFLPNSEIDFDPIIDYDSYVGKNMELKVLKIKETTQTAVVSHKALIESDLAEQREAIIASLEKGQILEGIVKDITGFGAFLDLGGVDGLLYITDISWGRISHPSEVLGLNQKISVVVLDIDEYKKRIFVGLKQLQPHPWEVLDNTISENSIVKGKIVNIEDYGAFLEIQPGVEGLIHVSEVSWSNQPNNAREFFKLGQEYSAKVVTVDRDKRKMSLSLKQMATDPWSEIENLFPLNSRHTGDVKNLSRYGVFIELQEGIVGMVHISDLSWYKRYDHPSEFTKFGEKLDVVILDIDKENRKLSLGHKQLEEDPWDTFENVFPVGSYHEATVLRRDDRGAIVQLPYGKEAFAPIRHIRKEDNTLAEVDDVITVKILELNRDHNRILVSHLRYLEDIRSEADEYLKNINERYNIIKAESGGETGLEGSDKPSKKQGSKLKKMFIGFAQADAVYLDALKKHLKLYERQNLIQIWDESMLMAGEAPNRRIEQELNAAEIILLLFSPDLLAEDFIWSAQMEKILEKVKRKEVHLIPILLRPSAFADTPFAAYAAVTERDKPISGYNNKDEAWAIVLERIKRSIQSSPTPSHEPQNSKAIVIPPTLINEINVLIEKKNTNEAIDSLISWANTNNQNQLKSDATVIKIRLDKLSREEMLGMLSFSEAARKYAEINNNLLSLLNKDLNHLVSPNPQTLIEEINDLIRKGNTSGALDALISWANANNQSQLKSDTANIKSGLETLKRNEILGMLSFSEAARKYAEINNNLLSLLNTNLNHLVTPTLQTLIEEINDLIRKGNTSEAIDTLISWANANNQSQLKSDTANIKSGFETLKRNEMLGMLSFSEAARKYAEINDNLLNLLNKGLDDSISSIPPVPNNKLKILMMTANPAGTTQLNLDKEQLRIMENLSDKKDQFELIVKKAIDTEDIKQFIEIEKPQVVHFSGHGGTRPYGGIAVRSEDRNGSTLISSIGLKVLFKYFNSEKIGIGIRAVILNGCYSKEQAESISQYVPYVIGTTENIQDEIAIAFSIGFYFRLAQKEIDFEKAYRSGVVQACLSGGLGENFVFYKNGAKLEE